MKKNESENMKLKYCEVLVDKTEHYYKQKKAGLETNGEWLNGFINAGSTTGIMTNEEINELIYIAQENVYGKRLPKDSDESVHSPLEKINESHYNVPALERRSTASIES